MSSEENQPELYRLFNPRSVAVVGATNNINKVGGQVISNLKNGWFPGKIFPINPKYDLILGKKAYPSIKKVPEQLDVVVSVIPNTHTIPIIEECMDAAVKFVIIITAGFQETQKFDPIAAQLTKDLKACVKKAKGITRMVGPNCMGITSTFSNLNAMMGFLSLAKSNEKFNVSVTSQSGTWTWNVVSFANSHSIGIANGISNGNEIDLTIEDFIEYFGFHDEHTDAILGFVEGFRNARKLKRIAPEISEKKPIIILKGGKTKSGATSASSHTGSIAGNYTIFKSFCYQNGIIEADNSSDLIDLARAIRLLHPNNYPQGKKVGIFTGGGGAAVILSDIVEKNGMELGVLQDSTINQLNKILPPHWPHRNPIDGVGSNDVWLSLNKLLRIIASDENIDIILPNLFFLGFREDVPDQFKKLAKDTFGATEFKKEFLIEFDRQTANGVIKISKRANKLIMVASDHYNALLEDEYEILTMLFEKGILVVPSPEVGCKILRKIFTYKKFLDKRKSLKD
ncbi:MAG: hypothetical protein EAX96_19625 [Candidatus Lokiarchaeota archaeon]|nr:hypothetical protein [Candidatus Lokiarchaeota archaeon]